SFCVSVPKWLRASPTIEGMTKAQPRAVPRTPISSSAWTSAVQGNPRLLPTAVAHLVRNALEATEDHPHGKVLIQLNRSSEPGMWSLVVYDNGPGIDPDHQSDIWRSFFTTKEGLRTGMGLSLTKQIVDKCNGQITVVPSPLGGTGFEILLASPPSGDGA
ncbi:MAG: ATP-binding protein, partial [Candidatus Sumerlaeota bacterium]